MFATIAKTLALIAMLQSSILTRAQIESVFIDTTRYASYSNTFFFTNRPLIHKKNGSIDFEDKWNSRTDHLYFVVYNPEKDSLMLKFRVRKIGKYINIIDGKNIFTKVFDDLYHKKGIRHFEIIIPGYAKTFKSQLKSFMHQLKANYSEPFFKEMAIITFAWGDEWSVFRYYQGKISCREGAMDFALFQSLLEDFLKDYPLEGDNPRDFTVGLSCFSMGNELFKQYLLAREKAKQPLVKTYESITLIGADAAWDSFKLGGGFHNIDKMTNQVDLFVNSYDMPLLISDFLNFKKRLGRWGPSGRYRIPDIVNVHDITDIGEYDGITGHNYVFENPIVRQAIIDDYIEANRKLRKRRKLFKNKKERSKIDKIKLEDSD